MPILTIKQLCTVSIDIYCLLDTRYQLTARSPDSGLAVAAAVFTSVGMHDGDTAHQPPATRREAWQQPTRGRSYNVQLEYNIKCVCCMNYELQAAPVQCGVISFQLIIN